MGEKKIASENSEWVSPQTLANLYDISRDTIYDWNYRPEKYDIPDGMLKKFGRALKINVIVFENWFEHRNS